MKAIAICGNMENQQTIASIFHSTKEKLKYELMLPLFRNIYFIAKEDLTLLKYKSLNDFCSNHGLEFNENYRNRNSGKEIMEAISRSIRENIMKDLLDSEYFRLSFRYINVDVSCIENIIITIRFINKRNEVS